MYLFKSVLVILFYGNLLFGQVLHFEAISLENPDFMYREFRPFIDSLEVQTGYKIELHIRKEYQQTIQSINEGKADLAFLSGTTFLIANEESGFQVMAEAQFEDNPQYQSVIITRSDSPIHDLTELKGKSFAFGSPLSTSNALYPNYMLLKAGLCLSDLSERVYLKHHNRIVLSVLNGRYDAGGVRKKAVENYLKYGLRILCSSEQIPNFCIARRKDLPQNIVNKIEQALKKTSYKNSYFDFFRPADNHLYDKVQTIKKYVEKYEHSN